MTRDEILEYFKDVNHAYNDCTRYDTLKRMLDELEQEPCTDAIRRQAILNTLDNMDNVLDEDRTVETYKMLLTECVNVLPPVTPTEKVGQWKSIRYWYECDKCGESNLENTNYCPSCGAKMQEVKNNEIDN